jgi:DNA-binding transcriptional LysR family regulator
MNQRKSEKVMPSNMPLESSLPNLLAFCRTYELGSFTRAAKCMRVTPAAVSRSVARLEQVLGSTLFHRTTRSLQASVKGHSYYDSCAQALNLLVQGERALRDNSEGPIHGRVRISVPTSYGLRHLLPRMSGFRARYPAVDLEIHISSQNIDFVRDGFDLAVRAGAVVSRKHGKLTDNGNIIARKLGVFGAGVFASPRYLAKRSAPDSIEALTTHQCIAFLLPSTGRIMPWIFTGPYQEWTPPMALCCAEDPMGCIALCCAGEGLIQTYRFLVKEELRSGALIEVLANRSGAARRFSLLYPKQTKRSKAVRAVIDFILEKSGMHANEL